MPLVGRMIEDDRWLTYNEIHTTFGIRMTKIQAIFQTYLRVKKVGYRVVQQRMKTRIDG